MGKGTLIRNRLDASLGKHRANFWCHVVEGSFASLGGSLVAGGGFVAALVVALGFDPKQLGYLLAVPGVAVLAQILTAPHMEAVRRKRRLVLLLGIGQRVPLLLTGIALLLLGRRTPLFCLLVLAASQLVISLSVNLLFPVWIDLLAETIPIEKTSRVFGFRSAISAALGIAAAGVAGLILKTLGFPTGYALLYLAAFALMTVSWLIFALVNEMPQTDTPVKRQPAHHYFRDLLVALREDVNYRYYLAFEGLRKMGVVGGAFYGMVAIKYLGMDPALVVVLFMVAQRTAAVAGNATIPFVVERVGIRPVLAAGIGLSAAASLSASLAPSGYWLVPIVFLSGLAGSTLSAAGTPFVMRLYPSGRRIGYITLTRIVLLPVLILTAPVAGWAIQEFGHPHFYWCSAAIVLAGILPLMHCKPTPKS